MINLGNEVMIEKNGKVVPNIGMADAYEQKRELMKENYVIFSINLDFYYPFDRGHKIFFDDNWYVIREETPPQVKSRDDYEYVLKFEGLEMLMLDYIFFYPYSDQPEGEWMLTAPPEYFFRAAIECMRKVYRDYTWTVGKMECTRPVDMNLTNISIFDAFTEVAKASGGEWYVEDGKINLVKKYEYGPKARMEREVNLKDIKRINENNEEYCTRMYAFGSTRNIPVNYRPANSGEVLDRVAPKRLRLPKSTPGYIDAFPDMKPYDIVPKVFNFDEIFPRRTGKITGVRVERKSGEDGKPFTIYYFKDSGIDFKLKYILPGQTLMMAFGDNSKLAGRDFELAYHEGSKEYEIINNNDNPDLPIPNELLIPKVGDDYVLYNFDIAMVGDLYVPEAEKELLRVATEKLRQIIEDNATYSCALALAYCTDEDCQLEVGQRVRLVSSLFRNGYKDSRIYGYSKKMDDITYLVGDTSSYSNLANFNAQIIANRKEGDENYNENRKKINVVNRTVKGLDYIKKALAMNTSVDGGLILSAILQLGTEIDGVFKGMAGLNGLLDSPEDVAFWIGGDIDDAVKRKTPLGYLANGSGWMANNMISWEVINGALAMLVTGKYQTAKSGERIEIDPETRSIKMIDDKERLIVNLSFDKKDNDITGQMRVYNYKGDSLVGSAYISGNKISLINQMYSEYFSVSLNDNKLNIKFDGIPEKREDTGVKGLYVTEDETLKLRKD